jgi:murein DD-endopeptidase MepM/ murein hydrolase activator NlpD
MIAKKRRNFMAKSNFSERAKSFFKKNYYYVIMSVCVLAIGAMITAAVVQSNKKILPPYEPNTPGTVIPDEPGEETGATPVVFLMPIDGVTGTGLVFDENELQYSSSQNQWAAHYGIDYRAPEGTTVSAVADGVVESITTDEMWGTRVVVLHDGEIRSIYACLGSDVSVLARQRVSAGQKLGVLSNHGYLEANEGPHLHFELTADGVNIDPTTYFEENK